ncbi:bifunctional metallophosphatase/5'-nucleotidase [Nautilia sp.]
MKKAVFFSLLMFLFIGCGSSSNVSKNFSLEIIHINDTHSHLESVQIPVYINGVKTYVYAGGYAKIANYIYEKKLQNPNVLTLHAGDAVQGTLYYTLFKGKTDVEALNLMYIDAMSVGNHEWDDGADAFAVNFANYANFPILGCDVNVSDNPLLKKTIKPFIIKQISGRYVAVVGDSIDSSVISSPGPTVSFLNYLTSAEKYVKELENFGINKIIFLTHLGYETDKYLASRVKGIDVIVGGHSHTLIGDFKNLGLSSEGEYPTVVDNNGSKTLIVTAWKWGLVVGDLNVTFDEKGNVIDYSGTPVMLVEDDFLRKDSDGVKKEVSGEEKTQITDFISEAPNIKIQNSDKRVQEVINRYKPEVDALLSQTVGTASEDLINVRLPGDVDPESNITLEHGSLIAPLVALSMYEKVQKEGCDFALQNAGGIRISIPQGNITVGEIYTLLPFGNTLVTLEMNGSVIKTMLENAIERSFITKTNTGAFPYLGNAKITIKKDNPSGNRIIDFKIKKDGVWVDFDENKTYKIVTSAYLAGGGDNYSEMSQAINKTDTGFVEADTFIEYVKQKQIISPLPDDETPVTVK